MNTVPAGRGRRISVPLPASSRTGGPLGRTWATLAAISLLPGGAAPVTTVVAAGTAGGERSSAALLATTPNKNRSRSRGAQQFINHELLEEVWDAADCFP